MCRTHVAFIRFTKCITDGYPAFATASIDLSLKSVKWLTELGSVIYNYTWKNIFLCSKIFKIKAYAGIFKIKFYN